jgi:DNA-binding MurR/RpiR family transcriptional regulator
MDVLREFTRESIETAGLPEVSGDIDRADTLADVVAKISLAETMSIADTAKTLDLADLRRAVDAVSAAERVDIFGVGASSYVGEDLQQKLIRIGRAALNWSSTHSAWTSAATLSSRTVEFLAMARSAGAATIAITNHARSPLVAHADVVLRTAARETGFRSGALGSRIAQLMVVDCLFIGVAQASYEQSMNAIRRTYAATHRLSAPGSFRQMDEA